MLTTVATRLSLTALFPWIMDMECSVGPEPEPVMIPRIERLTAGLDHTCVVADDGKRVRCWGSNDNGQLGQGHTMTIGDDEPAAFGEDVLLAKFARVVELAAGAEHTCARSSEGHVRCWGYGPLLGVAAGENLGDDEVVPIEDVDFGPLPGDPLAPQTVIGLAANALRTCVVLTDHTVRCWGFNADGELGLGFESDPIGDDEPVLAAPLVPVGAPLRIIAAGGDHVCGITLDTNVRCWGQNHEGQLGYATTATVGDNETPADVGDVDLGGDTIVEVALGGAHTCARTLAGKVRCWGLNVHGQLGYGHTANIGDDESPASAGYVEVDETRAVTQIAAGAVHTCAVLSDGAVKCWGYGYQGQLGHGDKASIGDDETPAKSPDVMVGGKVLRLTMGEHTCALLDSRSVRCWGIGYDGQLGYGDTYVIGDDESPKSAGDVLVF